MSWADQGFSWDMTHPREVFNHLWAALMEREDYGNPLPPDPLEPYDLNEFQLFDGRLFGSQYLDDGVSSKFSIPGPPDLPDPADILAGAQIPYTMQPITIAYLEEALEEPLIRVMPDRKAWLLRKLYLPWVIQRYRILNLLTERSGKCYFYPYRVYSRSVGRRYGEGSSGMIEELLVTPFSQSGFARPGITSETWVNMDGSSDYWQLSQNFYDLSLSYLLHKSCNVQVYAFGANYDTDSGSWCLDQVSESQGSQGTFYRSDYNDYGYGVPLGAYTMIKSFTYDAEHPEDVYFIGTPPADLVPLSPLSGPDPEWHYKSFLLPETGYVRYCKYAPYYQYYDPVMNGKESI